jgi:hypothetical protein
MLESARADSHIVQSRLLRTGVDRSTRSHEKRRRRFLLDARFERFAALTPPRNVRCGKSQIVALLSLRAARRASDFHFVADTFLPAMNVAGQALNNFFPGETRVEILRLARIGF